MTWPLKKLRTIGWRLYAEVMNAVPASKSYAEWSGQIDKILSSEPVTTATAERTFSLHSYYCLVFFYTYILHCISLFFDRVKQTNILSESE